MIYYIQLQKYIQNIPKSQDTIGLLAMKSQILLAQFRFLDTPSIFIYINTRNLPVKPLCGNVCLNRGSVNLLILKESKWKEISPTGYRMSSD